MGYPDERPIKRGAEPLFTIRGQDVLAVPAIAGYRDLCVAMGLMDQAAKVETSLQRFKDWQLENSKHTCLPNYGGGLQEQVGPPDLPPTPKPS